MAFKKDSLGYTTAKEVMGEGKSKPVTPPPAHVSAPQNNPHAIHRIEIEPADNGFTISHTPKSTGKKDPNADYPGSDYGKRQVNVFDDAAKAHHHIGRLLGTVKDGTSGAK